MTEKASSHDFSRRSFIKGAAVITAAGALAGCIPNAGDMAVADQTEPEEKVCVGICRGNCMGGCPVDVHVRDGRIVRTTAHELPDPGYTRICAKGLTQPFRVYSPERLQYPMKRIGERGAGEFERISWDEAISTITEKWKQYTDEFGPSAFAVYMGSGAYCLLNGMTDGNPIQRLINATGATYINFDVDYASLGTIGMTPSGSGVFGSGNEHSDWKNADNLIIWGANPVVSQLHDVHYMMEAQEAGTKIIYIDPQYNNLAEKADMYVPIKPATDAMLAIAMIKVMIEKGWVNEEFLVKYSNATHLVKAEDGMMLTTAELDASIAPEEAKECVLDASGKVVAFDEATDPVLNGAIETENGIKVFTAYSALLDRLDGFEIQTCLDTCGVPMETVEKLTDIYVNGGKSMLFKVMGPDHYYNGTSAFVAQNTLLILAGQIGGSGRGFAFSMNSGPIINSYGATLALDPEAPQGAFGWYIWAGQGISVLHMGEVMETHQYLGQEVNIKGLYISHINPLVSAADKNYMLNWMSKIEFIVMADMNMNESMKYADLILPAAHWFELEDVWTYAGTHPYAVFQEKATAPLYESRNDFAIIKDIAKGLGVEKWFSMTDEEYVNMALNDLAADLGITYASLKENKVMRQWYDTPYIFAEDNNFGSLFSIYRAFPYPMLNGGASYDMLKYRMIYWEPPMEVGYDNELRQKFPYQLFSDHSRFRTHSQWWDVEALTEIDKEPRVKICPQDAQTIGVQEGDLVKLYNDRGYAVMKVAIHAGLQPGMVTAEKGWQKSQLRDGDFASLSGSFAHPFVSNSAFNDVLVAIEKVS